MLTLLIMGMFGSARLPLNRQAAALTATPTPDVILLSPTSGQALQGKVAISGILSVEGYRSASVYFGYAHTWPVTWFWLADLSDLSSGIQLEWDTSLLTDGDYLLKVIVVDDNNFAFETTLTGLRVRNYSPIETDTPAPTLTATPTNTPAPWNIPTLTPTITPTPTLPHPTLTPLPANPGQLLPADIWLNLGRGAVGAAAALGLLGLYLTARKLLR